MRNSVRIQDDSGEAPNDTVDEALGAHSVAMSARQHPARPARPASTDHLSAVLRAMSPPATVNGDLSGLAPDATVLDALHVASRRIACLPSDERHLDTLILSFRFLQASVAAAGVGHVPIARMTGIRAILAGINAQCTQFIDQNAASAAPARDSGTHADRDDLYHIVSAIAEVAGRIDSLAGEVASLSKRLSQSRERPQGNPTETLIAEVRRAQLAQERRISASLGAMHGALERIAERLGRSDALFPPRAQVVPTEREDGETFHPFQDRGLTFPLEDTAFQDEASPPRSGLLDPRPMLAAARAAARRALSEAELSALQAPMEESFGSAEPAERFAPVVEADASAQASPEPAQPETVAPNNVVAPRKWWRGRIFPPRP